MRNLLFLVALVCAGCVKKKQIASDPIKRNVDILDEEDLEQLPETK
tara:strand:+ start:18986 stop:19123 length:138 start_codon:yes stop_codon:yes gene_type:complete